VDVADEATPESVPRYGITSGWPGVFTGREVNGGEEPPELFAGIL
jgi:hypothetical protein